jgi:hypothetical protein
MRSFLTGWRVALVADSALAVLASSPLSVNLLKEAPRPSPRATRAIVHAPQRLRPFQEVDNTSRCPCGSPDLTIAKAEGTKTASWVFSF